MVVEGYDIPTKTPIIHVAMQNAALWENPESFQPDCFFPGLKHAKRGHEFRPFGISYPRHCPANHFSYLLMSVCVTVLVQHFVFLISTSADEEEVVKKKFGTATSPSLKEACICSSGAQKTRGVNNLAPCTCLLHVFTCRRLSFFYIFDQVMTLAS